MYANVHDNQKPEIDAVEKRLDLSASFHGELDILDLIFQNLESRMFLRLTRVFSAIW